MDLIVLLRLDDRVSTNFQVRHFILAMNSYNGVAISPDEKKLHETIHTIFSHPDPIERIKALCSMSKPLDTKDSHDEVVVNNEETNTSNPTENRVHTIYSNTKIDSNKTTPKHDDYKTANREKTAGATEKRLARLRWAGSGRLGSKDESH